MSEDAARHGAPRRPQIDLEAAMEAAKRLWGVVGEGEELPGDRDRNFRVGLGPDSIVLKVTDSREEELGLAMEALERLGEAGGSLVVGCAIPTMEGGRWAEVEGADGRPHRIWAVRWVDGTPLAYAGKRAPGLLGEIGGELGRARRSLDGWEHPALGRGLKWDLRRGLEVAWELESFVQDPRDRRTIREALAGVEVALDGSSEDFRVGVIHGDASDHNVLVRESEPASGPCGLLDVGDIDRSWILGEAAVCAAYLMLEEERPVEACAEFVAGYHRTDPIPPEELGFLMDLARLRLCVSVTVAAQQRSEEPDNEYLSVTVGPALKLLERLQRMDRGDINVRLAEACGVPAPGISPGDDGGLLGRRLGALGPNLSLSYGEPIEVVRGEGRYLIERNGRSYLDGVNNVSHVGHCHPRVVEATSTQMRRLNTNTRYLSGVRLEFVDRLLSTFPEPLEVVYLVNSGSEANELARRLVTANSGGGDWVVLEGGYHGNTGGLVELSHYKFNGPGGDGKADHVRVAALPDRQRGQWGYEIDDAGPRYAADVARCIEEIAAAGRSTAAFLAESIPGCAGQVVLPDGYLAECYRIARAAGGLTIADEVQVGCGRVGSHWWAFQTQGVVPDVVTIGKPLGNGHPLGAVVTTREVARSFDGGMEYFNTFGGNPVSCAAGNAVLGVIEEEGLMENALETGAVILDGLRGLMERYSCIGDVRGLGLYLGVACVRDLESGEPDAALAEAVVEGMRRRGVLLSTDGCDHDVIKMKPPMVFDAQDAEHLLCMLDEAFAEAKDHA